MTGPDQIFATKTCTVYMDGSLPLQASTREFHRSEEYTRSDLIPAMIAEAVAIERERCAQLAESVAKPMAGKVAAAVWDYCRKTSADFIRKGDTE